jgi:hypothetical protein
MKMSNKLKWATQANLESLFNLQWTTPRKDPLQDFLWTWDATEDGRILKQVCGKKKFINQVLIHEQLRISKEGVVALIENPPFCNYVFNYCSTINQVDNYTYSCKFFLQLLTSNVEKYRSRVKLQSKVYATCQHHNNSHYVPLLTNLIEYCSTNIVKRCCQLHSTNGWTSSTN